MRALTIDLLVATLLAATFSLGLGCSPDPPAGQAAAAAAEASPAEAALAEGGAPETRGGAPAERRAAPTFALASLGGDLVRSTDFDGKTLVIDFWATWCPPCEFQVPELNAFLEAHAADGDVAVLGISVDADGPEIVEEWTTQKGVTYPILVGGEELARRFGALGFPTLYVVAPDGTIEMEHVGLIEVADLEAVLARVRSARSGS